MGFSASLWGLGQRSG